MLALPPPRCLVALALAVALVGCRAATRETAPFRGPALRIDRALGRMVQELTAEARSENREKLALLPFSSLKGESGDFGNYIAEGLLSGLHRSNKFNIIERSLLDKVLLEEDKLTVMGVIDPATAQKIGKVFGARWIGTGTYAYLGEVVDVNARLIETETGKVQAVSRVRVKFDAQVARLLGEPLPVEAPAGEAAAAPTPTASSPWAEEGNWVFEYINPNASAVYLSGDFNGWSHPGSPTLGPGSPTLGPGSGSPLALSWEQDEVWRARIPLTAGEYAYMFVVDGEWVIDPANPKTRDNGSDGQVSVVTVP